MDDWVIVTVEELNDSDNGLVEGMEAESESDYDPFEGTFNLDKTLARKHYVAYNPPDDMFVRVDPIIADIIKEHCLPFLPAKTLARFRTVCKEWNSWIGSPFLSHKQTNFFRSFSGLFRQTSNGYQTFISLDREHYGIPDPSLNFLPESVCIRTACNGLLCCQDWSGDSYYVCNPVNKEWNQLPKPNFYHGIDSPIILAFDPSELGFGANFKLICALVFPDNPAVYFEIYSSKRNSWRLSETICCELDALALKNGGFYMKDVVYWHTLSGKVLAFHMKDEYCGILGLPPSFNVPDGVLTEVKGELCYILLRREGHSLLMIDIYGVTNLCLKQTFCLSVENLGAGEARALPCINGEVLVFLLGNKVMAYDAHTQETKFLTYMMNDTDADSYFPYVNSLVSVVPQRQQAQEQNNLDSSLTNIENLNI